MSGEDASPRSLGEGDRALRGGVGGARVSSQGTPPPLAATRPPPPGGEEKRRARAAWSDALRVAALLAADPFGCGGAVIRAGAGPVRDLWLDFVRAHLPSQTPWRRLPPGIADDRLLGGLDLAATLRAGRPVAQNGLLAESHGGIVVVPMAERLSAGLVARLCSALDTGTVGLERDGLTGTQPARFGLVLLDEGGEDEAVAEALADRLAFRVDLSEIGLRDIDRQPLPPMPDRLRSVQAESFPRLVAAAEAARVVEPAERFTVTVTVHGGEPRTVAGGGVAAGAAGQVPRAGSGSPGDDSSPLPGETSAAAVDPIATLCAAAVDLGIASLRGPLLAARVARLAARLDGRDGAAEMDVVEAARLVLAPRATRLPVAEPPEQSEPAEPPPDAGEPPPPSEGEDDARPLSEKELDDLVLEAARAAIPPNLLAQLLAGGPRLRSASAGRVGAAAAAPRSGRPAGSRPGDPRRGRLDLIATLRAAAPWQRLRRRETHTHPHPEVPASAGLERASRKAPGAAEGSFEARLRLAPRDEGRNEKCDELAARRVIVLPDDLRIKRLVQRTETTTIFCVDASGSAALERLAEAKGAVELLLAESYVRRDKVALVAFRGAGAQLVLPPTRSLVRAKRALGGLPGGGGTPLASGIDAAATLALSVRRGGGSPVVVLLTDGRANVARSGEGGRAKAGEEALDAGRTLRGLGLPALVIDTGARPEGARRLAEAAGARYIPLPYADASGMSAAVRAATASGSPRGA